MSVSSVILVICRMSDQAQPVPWIEELVTFLRAQPDIRAVRVDPTGKKLSVATLGDIDPAAVHARVAATIAAIEARLKDGAQRGRRRGAAGLCVLGRWARRLKWRGLVAPRRRGSGCGANTPGLRWRGPRRPRSRSGSNSQPLAAACGGLGIVAFVGAHFWGAPMWLTRGLYVAAILTGGWDAAKDTWEKLSSLKLDIHFLMLAVAAGAMAIGAWGEATLLLFLFSASGAMEECSRSTGRIAR